MRKLLQLLDDHFSDVCLWHDEAATQRMRNAVKSALAQPDEPFEIEWPEYHDMAMGCGLEDRNITDRYDAMSYGWDNAIDAVARCLPEKLYTHPQPERKPLTDEEIRKISTDIAASRGVTDWSPDDCDRAGVFELSRAIEAAHGIK